MKIIKMFDNFSDFQGVFCALDEIHTFAINQLQMFGGFFIKEILHPYT